MAPLRHHSVAWTEGMFLRPHHFQHHDLFLLERMRRHASAIDPFHWGVVQVEVNEEALSAHRVELLRLEAILPDGTFVSYPGAASLPAREFDATAERTTVYLALPRVATNEPSVQTPGAARRDARFELVESELPDLARGGAGEPVEQLRPSLRLLLSGEESELERHDAFRLCDVVATGEIARPFALAPEVGPPLVTVQAWAPLHDRIQEVVSQIAAKARVVAARTAGTGVGDLPRLWMRYTLARLAPLLRHVLSTGHTRPYELYTVLVEAAGALAAFHADEPAELPVYAHDDPVRCFGALLDFVEARLSSAVPTSYEALAMPYDAEKKVYLTTDLNTDRVDPHHQFYLGVKASLERKELVDRVLAAKLGALGDVRVALLLSKDTLPIEHMASAPLEIAATPGFEYFRLDAHHENWKRVRDDFDFALSLPKVESADVRLYVVTGGS